MAKNRRKQRRYKKEDKIYIGLIAVSAAVMFIAAVPTVKDAILGIGEMAVNELEISDTADSLKQLKDGISDSGDEIKSELEKEGFLDEWERAESEAEEEQAPLHNDNEVTFVRVVDGDTYVINIGGVDTKVRLIGVDTPESVAPSSYSKDNTQEGKDVSEIMKDKLTKGDTLTIEYDVQKTDKYGRTLAYLYFADGEMIQEWLLENGYAQCMTVQPNSKYADDFANIQHTAAENKVGLWNGYFEE